MRPFSLRLAIVVLGAAVLTALAGASRCTRRRRHAVERQRQCGDSRVRTRRAHSSVLSSAMVQGAVYDAVNGIVGGYEPYLVKPAGEPVGLDRRGGCDRGVQGAPRGRPGNQTAALATLAAQYSAALAAVPAGAAKDGGIAAGEAAAAAMLAARTNDGRNPTTPFPFVFGTTPGVWRRDAAADDARTDTVGRQREAVPRPGRRDAAHEGAERSHEQEVRQGPRTRSKSLGSFSSTTRTPDETSAAIFWQSPPLFLWGGLERSLSARFGLSTAENARLFAEVSLARRTPRSAAGTTSTTGTSGGRPMRSTWPTRTATRAPTADPRGDRCSTRRRRRPGARDAELPRPPVRPQLPDRRDHERDAATSSAPTASRSTSSARASRARRSDAPLRQLLGRHGRSDQRARLGRHPLPHRRRAGRQARQEGRPLGGRTTTSSATSTEGRARTSRSSRSCPGDCPRTWPAWAVSRRRRRAGCGSRRPPRTRAARGSAATSARPA